MLDLLNSNRHMQGGRAHLPEIESVCSKMIKLGLRLLLDYLLQFNHRLTHPNLNREGPVRLVENPTEEPSSKPLANE